MRPGEELKDGPPIHGNTRLEIDLDRDPGDHPRRRSAPTPTSCCTTSRRPRPPRCTSASSASSSRGPSTTPARAARRSPRRSSTCPRASQVKFTSSPRTSCTTSGSPPSGMKIDAVPGITTSLPRHADQARHVPGGVRRAVRARARVDAPERPRRHAGRQFDKWLAASAAKAAAGAAGGAAGGGGGAAPDGKTIFTSTASPACGSCHTLADAGTTGTIGPDLDKCPQGQGRDVHPAVDRGSRAPMIAKRLPGRDHAAELRPDAPAGAAQGAWSKYLVKVTASEIGG